LARYKAILAYDGTGFYGFQRQAKKVLHSQRTVQRVIEEALQCLGWQGRSILAAGRTDTGVHASGQVIAFDLEWAHPPERLQAALNASLPADVAVQAVQEVALDFHPRFDAKARRYCYRLFCQPVRDPLRERYAWRVWPGLDLQRMQEAATYLPGSHDFAAFGSSPRAGSSTVRNVLRAGWQEEGDGLCFEILANAFLFRMVRRLVGFQVTIGRGELTPEALADRLEDGRAALVKNTAPPQGLNLVEVMY
jgi:tRNA pseudouridine38-40 synthase